MGGRVVSESHQPPASLVPNYFGAQQIGKPPFDPSHQCGWDATYPPMTKGVGCPDPAAPFPRY